MSSHREAPAISKDPVAAQHRHLRIRQPRTTPGTVTIISNYLPLEAPFGDLELLSSSATTSCMEIHIDNDADGRPDITYQFEFNTQVRQPGHVPLQHRPDHRDQQPQPETRRQFYSVMRVATGRRGSGSGHRPGAARPAISARPPRPNYAAVAVAGGLTASRGGHTVFRRPGARGVLRGPGGDLRPRRPAPAAEPCTSA